jgi:cholesterol transport system auxiliary component
MKRIALALAMFLVAACAGTNDAGVPRTYDFGLDAPSSKLAGLRVGVVRAAAPFDTTDMLYRLAFRDPAELLAFAESRWAATPAILLQRRIARASSGAPATCSVDLELTELSQVFSAPEASEVVLEGRATLVVGTKRVGERMFRVVGADAGRNAAGGVQAVARAADRLIVELAAWAAAAAPCSKG